MKQKVLRNETRRCSCGKKVRYYLIADAESTSDYFVKAGSTHTGPAIKRCPGCRKKLSTDSTSKR